MDYSRVHKSNYRIRTVVIDVRRDTVVVFRVMDASRRIRSILSLIGECCERRWRNIILIFFPLFHLIEQKKLSSMVVLNQLKSEAKKRVT